MMWILLLAAFHGRTMVNVKQEIPENNLNLITSGYDAQTQESFRLGHRGLQPEATILLHYDSGRQKWYYASQLNMNPRAIFDKNNKKIPLTNMNDAYLNGKTYKVIVMIFLPF